MSDRRTVVVVLVALLFGSAIGAGTVSMVQTSNDPGPTGPAAADPGDAPDEPPAVIYPDNGTDRERLADADVEQFESEEEFRAYVARHGTTGPRHTFVRRVSLTGRTAATAEAAQDDGGSAVDRGGGGAGNDERVSSTNVQEQGVDEPDVLKADGQVVFYAGGHHRHGRAPANTHVVDISDPGAPELITSIPEGGQLLLVDDVLVVQTGDALVGYDVSDADDPREQWRTQLNDSIVTARLLDGDVYLVTSDALEPADPCPVRPFGADGPTIGCDEVYHPTRPATADATYTTSILDPETGSVEDAVSVVGSNRHQATYVSENAVYLTYSRQASEFDLFSTYLLTEKGDVLDDRAERRIRRVRSLNISDRAKQTELRVIVGNWYQRLPEERRQEVQESVQEGYQEYLQENRRELVRTGLVKVDIGDELSVEATGEVPGYPLNQFSMDERNDTLRIATTVGRQWGGTPTNDLYVLDEELSIMGAEKGMAENERIFSVRYVGDTAYLVTFRRIDPFHVVDLSDPSEPEELGNVELPGFSTYLHPIGENRMLGIGEENGKVKAVIFDVSEPSDPKVEDSLILQERWSAVSNTHHAFLQDERHGVFFLPGSRGGYVVDYTDGKLAVEKRVETDGAATRAMYHGDYLYVFDQEGMVVVDETDWTTVDRVDFDESYDRRLSRDRIVSSAR